MAEGLVAPAVFEVEVAVVLDEKLYGRSVTGQGCHVEGGA